MCVPQDFCKIFFLFLELNTVTLASFLWILPTRVKWSGGWGSFLVKWARSVDLFKHRHFTLIQETFMEQVQSSVLVIHVLFAPSFTHSSDPIFAASHFRGNCSGRGAVPLRPWKGSRCRFRRLDHAPSRVSEGVEPASRLPSRPVVCQSRASEHKVARLR